VNQVSDDVRSAALALLALVGGSLAAQWVQHDFWDVGTWAVAIGVWVVLEVVWITVRHRRRPGPPPAR
jgi:predicted tellurium resistance membrane protein TerC